MQLITVGVDIAKNVFQPHGIDGEGRAVLRRKVRRDRIWANRLLDRKPARLAEAICEAVTRPTMRFVPIKEHWQQVEQPRYAFRRDDAVLGKVCPHRAHLRRALPHQQVASSVEHEHALRLSRDAGAGILPELARQTLLLIAQLMEVLTLQIRKIETELLAWHRSNPASQRLETIPGVGFITATALAATVLDARAFRSGRQFAAWLGLVPRQNSSGGKDRLGGTTKMGDRYLRYLLVIGATAVVRYTRRKATTIIDGPGDPGHLVGDRTVIT